VAIGVSNLRRSSTGRRFLAVRGNERSAAASGINVTATKLQAFALSACIAGIGGAMLGYQSAVVSPESFGAFQAISLLTLVYITGVASVSGALLAGLLANGGLVFVLASNISGLDQYWSVLGGIAVIVNSVAMPDGVAVTNQRSWQRFVAALPRLNARTATSS
jgi:ABC-type branched-subunit amino acid transport system permease subunit